MKRTKSYSLDLRLKVIAARKNGMKLSECERIFGASRCTIWSWLQRKKETGHVEPKKRGGSKGKIDLVKLKAHVKANPNQTLWQIGRHFQVTDVAILYRLRELGWSYKKKDFCIAKAAQLKEQRTSG